MIYNKHGQVFICDNGTFIIGGSVIATDESEYQGLYGTITEIRTDEDRETENDTPDIYCSFEPPVYPHEIREFESVFSDLYGEPKTLDDISLDEVIMAPEMIRMIPEEKPILEKTYVYLVQEDWMVDDEGRSSISSVFTNKGSAQRYMREQYVRELEEGCIHDWKDDEHFVEDSAENYYECYIDGFYLENHYRIFIEQTPIEADSTFARKVHDAYRTDMVREDIEYRYSEEEFAADISPEKIAEMAHSEQFVAGVVNAIDNSDRFWEAYWDVIDYKMKEYCNGNEK